MDDRASDAEQGKDSQHFFGQKMLEPMSQCGMMSI